METDGLETRSESVEHAVDLLDRLLSAADGGRGVTLGQYEATTILALLMDKAYRVEVLSRLGEFTEVDSEM